MKHDYAPPVSDLLTIGEPLDGPGDWDNYVADFGYAPGHVPELVRMATDPALARAPSNSDEVWGPVHAWRVLGQLRAPEAVEPLLAVVRAQADDDWVSADLPEVLARIGSAALPGLAAMLQDRTVGQDARMTAASGLARLAQREDEHRAAVVDLLAGALDDDRPRQQLFNGRVVGLLLDLEAVEAAPAMERAFAAGRVDVHAAGDWEDVQVELGLIPERLTLPPPGPFPEVKRVLNLLVQQKRLDQEYAAPGPAAASPESRKGRDRARARKKMAKKSRKQNRR